MDAVRVDPKHYKVEFENDKVRVLRVKYGPREKSVMHDHGDVTAVFLTDHNCRFEYPEGGSEVLKAQAGDVKYMPAFSHLPENLANEPMELILIETKK